jgi:NADH-quinone oxidoreductase subunit E
MMAASSNQNENGATDKSAELGRLAAEMLLKSPFLAMNPTLVPPTAALAAATIIGFGLSTQVAGAFFGALQGAMDVANRFAAEQAEAAADEAKPPNDAAPVEATKQTKDAAPAAETLRVDGKASTVTPDTATTVKGKSKRNVKKTIEPSDLKRISGIGPKLEQLLNGLGIRSAAQISAWTQDEVERIDAALGVDGRIARDNWVAQAKKLAS